MSARHSASVPALVGMWTERVGGEMRRRRRAGPPSGEREDRHGRAGERDVVARPWAPRTGGGPERSASDGAGRARRPAPTGGGEAAQLERGGHVHRAVQRAADDGAEQRDPRRGRRWARHPDGSAAPRPRRWASAASSGSMRVASDAVSAERNDSRRNTRRSSSGSTARLASVVMRISRVTFSAITAP